MKQLNVAQCVLLVKNLDNVGYLPLSEWKKLDEVVVSIKTSVTYNELWDSVKAKAEEIMQKLREKNQPMEEEVTKLQAELQEKVANGAKKKEIKALRQKIGEMANESQFNIKAAQQELLEFQDNTMDLNARETYIVEVEDDFYDTLNTKFHIGDKEFDPNTPTSGFVQRLDTDNLEADVEIPETTVLKNEKNDEK